jgi:hypothetical protein
MNLEIVRRRLDRLSECLEILGQRILSLNSGQSVRSTDSIVTRMVGRCRVAASQTIW